MLMTPMTPKVMARPMAAKSSTEPSDRPYQAFCTIDHIARLFWIDDVALAAARAIAGGWRVRGMDDVEIGFCDITFVGVGMGHQGAARQRADDALAQGIAAGQHSASACLVMENFVICEFAARALDGSRHDRQRSGNNQ